MVLDLSSAAAAHSRWIASIPAASLSRSDNRQEFNGYAQVRLCRLHRWAAPIPSATASAKPSLPDGDLDHEVFGAGATYAWSRYAVGLGWTRGRYENGFTFGSDQYDVYALTGSYVLGPGITIDGLIGYSEYEGTDSFPFFAERDYQAVEIGLGTAIRF